MITFIQKQFNVYPHLFLSS